MTAQGSPRTRFNRAIEGGWIFHAELAAREMGSLTLLEALQLVELYAEHEPAKFERAAVKWLSRLLVEVRVSLLSAQIAAASLGALPGDAVASRALRDLAAGGDGLNHS